MNLHELNPKKVLIVSTFGIGDVLFTTPLISNLKVNFPNVFIAYLANRRVAPMLEEYSKVNKVFIYERDEFNAVYKKSKIEFLKKIRGLYREIKKEDFDLVFDFSMNRSADFMMWWAEIKTRIGFNYRNRSPYLTHKFPFEGFENKHVADHYLELFEKLGGTIHTRELEMTIPDKDKQWAKDFLQKNGYQSDRLLIGVLPGAGASWGQGAKYRRWDPNKYAQLVDKLIEKFNAQIILMGDQNESDLCDKVAHEKQVSIIRAYGKTSLTQFAALLLKCQLFVLNDGGPLHIASAVKVPTVSIFGPVDPIVYGPYGKICKHVVVQKSLACQPCYRRFHMPACGHVSCLKNIEVEDVFKKVKEILEKI